MDWIKDFDLSRTIGGLAILKIIFVNNEMVANILDSAISYLKEYERQLQTKDKQTNNRTE